MCRLTLFWVEAYPVLVHGVDSDYGVSQCLRHGHAGGVRLCSNSGTLTFLLTVTASVVLPRRAGDTESYATSWIWIKSNVYY